MSIPVGFEVATFIDVDQFIKDHSVDTCGFITVLLNHFAAPRGKPYPVTPAVLQSMQAIWYAKFDGPDTASNHNGMTNAQLYTMIVEIGNHYQNLYPDGGVSPANLKAGIKYWIGNGYPVIVAIEEESVTDVALGYNPYNWNTAGLSHIITVTGVAKSGNLLIRDTANVGRPGPREYDLAKLHIIEATVFVPEWLPRPYSAFEVAKPQPTQQVPVVAPVAIPTLTMNDIATALSEIDSALQKVIAAIKKTAPQGPLKPQ